MKEHLIYSFHWIIFITSCVGLIGVSIKYTNAYKHLSRGQKLIVGACLAFLWSGFFGGLQNIKNHGDFRWGSVPYIIGVFLTFVYIMEPARLYRKRWGRDPFSPKGNGEL